MERLESIESSNEIGSVIDRVKSRSWSEVNGEDPNQEKSSSQDQLVHPVVHTTKESGIKHNSIYSDVKDSYYIEYSEGGNSVHCKSDKRDCFRTDKQKESRRGVIKGFSRKSRNRLLWLCGSLDRSEIDPKETLFITLTYPSQIIVENGKEIKVQDIDGKTYKKHLNHFVVRLKQKHPNVFGLVRFEFQKRGVGHYHVCLFGLRYLCRDWVGETWNNVVGGDPIHRDTGTQVERSRGWGETTGYFSKTMSYLGKETDEDLDQELREKSIGRHWSHINKKFMERFIKFRVMKMNREEFFRFRRVLFKLYKSVKRRKLITIDEFGYEYWESSKLRRFKKQMKSYNKWKQTRIHYGGSLHSFFPNELLRKILVGVGVKELDFDERFSSGRIEG